MKIEKVNINDLISPSYNPRDITPTEMEKLKTSIQEFGYVDPIIVNDVNNHIVGGNQRYEAMKQLGFEEVEVSYVHIEDLNREKALNIRLNNNSGEWDINQLNSILGDLTLKGLPVNDLTGFQEVHLSENNFQQPIIQSNQDNIITDYPNENNVGEFEDYSMENQENEYEYEDIDDFQEIKIDDFEGEHKCPKCGFEWND